jgi:predicted transcriptional regulator
METVWRAGEATVQQVRDRIDPRQELAYTTILSVMQKLEKAGWLRHRAIPGARAYVYTPARSREQAGSGVLRVVMDRVFGGDPLLLFERLIDDPGLTDKELAELRRMIDQRRKERRRS